MSDSRVRPYDESTDLDAVFRIWKEIGWLDDDAQRTALGTFMGAGNAEVAVLDDAAECMVHWSSGTIDHTGTRLGLCAISAVTTSLIGRKQGFASTMTARALQQGTAHGHAVAALGMFEQGFYDRLGFGTAADSIVFQFDPSNLLVDGTTRRVARLGPEHGAEMYAAMLERRAAHGSITLQPCELFTAEVSFETKAQGLGYRDDDGRLTHFVFGKFDSEHGPFDIRYLAYRTSAELSELFGLLAGLGDQVRSVKMIEPPHAQIQSMLRAPLRDRMRTRASVHEAGGRAIAWWQLRMLDVPACIAAHDWHGDPVEFNLTLDDPVAGRLDGWAGVAGDYVVTVGAPSSATGGHRAGLPTLRTTVNTFSRLWFGVRSASALATTDRLEAPAELIDRLDHAVCVPAPYPNWEF